MTRGRRRALSCDAGAGIKLADRGADGSAKHDPGVDKITQTVVPGMGEYIALNIRKKPGGVNLRAFFGWRMDIWLVI